MTRVAPSETGRPTPPAGPATAAGPVVLDPVLLRLFPNLGRGGRP